LIRIAGALALLLGFALLAAATFLGAFTRVRVEERSVGPHHFVYRTMHGADPVQVGLITDQVGEALRAAGVTQLQPLDLYYPEGSRERNEIGFAVGEADAARAASLDASFLQRTLPAEAALTVRFPWKHPLSYVVGALRVIPALRAYRAANGYQDGPSYTLHDGDTILYVQPIRR